VDRRILRIASAGLALGAAYGVVLGSAYLVISIQGTGNAYLGLLAGWALIVLAISAGVATFAYWTWRTAFKQAAIGLALAGVIVGSWALLYVGHDDRTSIACGMVSGVVLGSTAMACLFRMKLRHSD
jgi:hypothetical protein